MLHLDVYIDLIYIMRVGREFFDSIKHSFIKIQLKTISLS